jgi:hypothetical protein
MATIDIKKNYRQYSPPELRELAYKRLLTCGSYDLDDFLEYIFTGYEEQFERNLKEKLNQAREDWESNWDDDFK